MEATVESLCGAMTDSRLLTPDAAGELQKRWRREAKGPPSDAGAFARWLVAKGVATKFQLGVLAAGRGDQLSLGQYKLLDRIGRGRVAGVFKAVHSLGQTVAVKVLPPSKTGKTKTFARFQREAKLARRLNHPNVVRTFQLGVDDGVYYLVMEHLVGETLAEVLARRHALPPDEAVYVVHQALLGLQHVHEQGLVHRDLAPDNLMLIGSKPDDTRPATVKILDIGTGRALLDDEDDGKPKYDLTVAGDQLGTPEYMAPEQAADAHKADVRSDLYSIGCILFHALAGEPPFVEKNRVRLVMRHVTEAPRSLLAVCPDAPPKLQGVLDRLLAKQPGARFATPAEALQALKPFLPKVAPKAAGSERPELKAFLRWLDTESEIELPPPTPAPSAAPAKNAARRSLLADLANPTSEPQLPEWLAKDDPETPDYAQTPAGNDFGIDLSGGKPSGGRSAAGNRTLLIAGVAAGAVCILLLLTVIVILLRR